MLSLLVGNTCYYICYSRHQRSCIHTHTVTQSVSQSLSLSCLTVTACNCLSTCKLLVYLSVYLSTCLQLSIIQAVMASKTYLTKPLLLLLLLLLTMTVSFTIVRGAKIDPTQIHQFQDGPKIPMAGGTDAVKPGVGALISGPVNGTTPRTCIWPC
ncbi:hypothetical protein Pcinc_023073 [Petrolisthes cinctipes]|uniref:Uncharacterized protein n=1 Tax=Petrolisthes cinctipes TaxID=88211 RepID=A0AAE1FDL2_PETCI|nr:hypothetical protein Pcinc_023073 [Petrolisthes cinctipes]